MVYVLNKNGEPLMPTSNYAKVRILLSEKKATVVHSCPFTIKLLYDTTLYTQKITLGVDAGSKHIGVSATTEAKTLYEAEIELRTDITKLLSTRKENRRARRNRKTRYRKPRFDNRKASKKIGWLSPSIQHKINTHLQVVNKIHKILPITKIIVETAAFDIQKIKNPNISGTEYQEGEQRGFWNVREYVLFRDGHTCQCCNGKTKDRVLNVHHIESRKTGGDAPNNLITLCETCHTKYHRGDMQLPKSIHRGMSFRDATFMGIMRLTFYNKLKNTYPNVSMTYGYITKNTRIRNQLPKEHYIDARCISGHPTAKSDGTLFYQKKVRCHNRQIHKMSIGKDGKRKRNQASYIVNGFRIYDKVLYKQQTCFIFGRRTSGYFNLRTLDGTKISPSASYKKLKLLEKNKHYLTERRNIYDST